MHRVSASVARSVMSANHSSVLLSAEECDQHLQPLQNPTNAPMTIEAPMMRLVYASKQVESKWPRRINSDMTSVDVDLRQSAPTCRNAANMFTSFALPVLLLLLQNSIRHAMSKPMPPKAKP